MYQEWEISKSSVENWALVLSSWPPVATLSHVFPLTLDPVWVFFFFFSASKVYIMHVEPVYY